MTKEQKRLLSGMLKDYMPNDIDYADIQKFDANGKAIPISDMKIVGELEPKSKDSVHAAADIAEQIKAELKRMLKSMNKEKPKKEKGMLSTAKEESNAKEDQIAKGYHQMPDGSKMKGAKHGMKAGGYVLSAEDKTRKESFESSPPAKRGISIKKSATKEMKHGGLVDRNYLKGK